MFTFGLVSAPFANLSLNLCIFQNKKLVIGKSVTKSKIVTKSMVTEWRFHCISNSTQTSFATLAKIFAWVSENFRVFQATLMSKLCSGEGKVICACQPRGTPFIKPIFRHSYILTFFYKDFPLDDFFYLTAFKLRKLKNNHLFQLLNELVNLRKREKTNPHQGQNYCTF